MTTWTHRLFRATLVLTSFGWSASSARTDEVGELARRAHAILKANCYRCH